MRQSDPAAERPDQPPAPGPEHQPEQGAAFTAAALAVPVPPADPAMRCAEARLRLDGRPEVPGLAVIDGDGRVVGLAGREALAAATPDTPVGETMDSAPLTVAAASPLDAIGLRVAREKPSALTAGFVVVDADGRYLGVATVSALLAKSAEQAELHRRELDRARRDAVRADKAKTAFLANMSHEIRTPLNAMMGFAEILEQEVLGPHTIPLYRDYARDIAESGRHLMELINDLLDLSKADADRLELNEGLVDVPRVATGSARLLAERASRARVRIAVEVPRDLPPLQADERKLRQMLLNLLSNAVKFTPTDGLVTLAGGLAADGALYLSVTDTGIGMTGEELAKALEPWGQIDSALSRKHVGTGLGLPLTKRLIELHGGRLDILSVPGTGTTMKLVFPGERVG